MTISFNGNGGRNIREEGVVSPFEKLIYQHNMGLINPLPQSVCEFVDEGMRSTLLLIVQDAVIIQIYVRQTVLIAVTMTP